MKHFRDRRPQANADRDVMRPDRSRLAGRTSTTTGAEGPLFRLERHALSTASSCGGGSGVRRVWNKLRVMCNTWAQSCYDRGGLGDVMHWLKLPFIIFGMLVTFSIAGTSATIGYNIATASTCTQVDSSYSIGNCSTSVAGIPLSWVHDVTGNIVSTVIGSIITFGFALLLLYLLVAGLVFGFVLASSPILKGIKNNQSSRIASCPRWGRGDVMLRVKEAKRLGPWSWS